MRRSLTHRTMAGILWMACSKGAQTGLQMLVLAILARLVTPADFGVVSAALVVIGLSSIVSQLGVGPALVQRPDLQPRHVDTAFTSSLLLGLLLGGAIWGIAGPAASFFRIPEAAPVLRALAWTFPLQGLGIAAEALKKRELCFRWLATLEVVAYAAGFGLVGISLAALGLGVWALVAANVAHALVRSGVLLASHPPRLRHSGDRRSFRELMYFGGGFTLAKLANYAALQGDNLVVARTLGPAALGFYGRAYQLMTAPAHGIGSILDAVLFPAMARVQDDAERLRPAFRRGVALIAILVLPASLGLAIVAPEVVRVVLGPQWGPVVPAFQILAFGMLFRTSYKMSDSVARSTGAVYRRAWRQALYAALVVGGAWIGQHWGIAGVAAGVLGAVTANFLCMAGLSLRVTGMTWGSFGRAHLPAARLTMATAPPVWLAAAMLRAADAPAPAIVAAAGVAGAASGLLLAWRLTALFLGTDGLWILEQLRRFALAAPRPRVGAAGAALGTPHPGDPT